MRLAIEKPDQTSVESYGIHLPFGLIGLPKLTRFEVAPIEGSWPFLSMRATTGDEFDFIAIEPFGIVPGYDLELSDSDAEALQISTGRDALVLNIVSIHSFQPQYVTVNLVGPVVVNRMTLVGKQVLAANADRYSTHYVLIDERGRAHAA